MVQNKAWAQRGFTIIELIVVIVVIAILTAITIVTYVGVKNRSFDTAIQADLKSVAAGLKSYKAATGTYPTSETQISTMQDSTGTVVSGAVPKVSHDGYDQTSPSNTGDNVSRNLLICVRSGGTDPEFGIAAYSKSGNVWFYTSNGGLTQNTQGWVGQQTTECPRLGIATTDPGYARWFGYQRDPSTTTDLDAGWRGWAVN
ncbi:MAG TPA: prepilin-type N-terminal cleavage/methylation domain-containing protein [Candidatus Saccharimonadales bacterium]